MLEVWTEVERASQNTSVRLSTAYLSVCAVQEIAPSYHKEEVWLSSMYFIDDVYHGKNNSFYFTISFINITTHFVELLIKFYFIKY